MVTLAGGRLSCPGNIWHLRRSTEHHAIQRDCPGYAGWSTMIRRTEENWFTVVATGGLSTVMASLIPAIKHLEPMLTLNGLNLVKKYVSGNEQH